MSASLPHASAPDGRFVVAVPRTDGPPVPVQVVEAQMEDLWRWEDRIQPHVRDSPDFRFDAEWHWPSLLTFARQAEWLAERVGYRPACELAVLQIMWEALDGNAVPIGQLMVANGYPFRGDRATPCVFLWYMAAAPKGALAAFGAPANLQLGRVLVDCAVQESLLQGYEGRLLLHAARKRWNPDANKRLYSFYERLGLTPAHSPRWLTFGRRNDERYFSLAPAQVLEFTAPLDYLRPKAAT